MQLLCNSFSVILSMWQLTAKPTPILRLNLETFNARLLQGHKGH